MKTLLIDIETRPNLGYVWSLWNQNVGLNQLVESGETICFAAEWLEKPRDPVFFSVHHNGKQAMAEAAWKLLDEADAVIHYNGRRFDVPHLNALFYELDMTPPSPYKQIDLLSVVRKQFRIPSKKLEYVTKWSGLPTKVSTGGFELWTKCMAGDEAAWRKMERYNRNDTKIMRALYYKMLPWIDGHPNQNLYNGKGCPKCGKGNLQKRGFTRTGIGVYQRYQCVSCGGWSKSGKSIATSDIREDR